ncbi:hypothetical protein RJ639_043032 [Escallonia herrerae]|uniref:Phosphofructokinase domain-containing protein n=1 Tax=Escallonia herrerae TaxID=1293975 RepID=A0AA88WDG7_9ASTE|nr:hypothetical protein RJ639_043032 [Escallonia herrerae]
MDHSNHKLMFCNGFVEAPWPSDTAPVAEFEPKIVYGDDGFVLEDVPHVTDYLHELPVRSYLSVYLCVLTHFFLDEIYAECHQKRLIVNRQYFVRDDDAVAKKVIVHNGSPRGTHFRRAGPRQRVYFESEEVKACIVTCGSLCPGINTVIREIVCGLYNMYGVKRVLGIHGGYKGFHSRNTISLTPKVVNDIHKRGGTVLETSRGGHNARRIVDSIQDRGINQVYIIGGDETHKGASEIFQEIRRRGLKVSVAGIPRSLDNDIPVIDRSFGFDTAVEEAQRAINSAHAEAESSVNGIGVVKLMGRQSGFIAMYASLASRDVDCCLIPESPFYLEGPGGLFEYIGKQLIENGHVVIVIAEGAGRELHCKDAQFVNRQVDSRISEDVGFWMSAKIKVYFMMQILICMHSLMHPDYLVICCVTFVYLFQKTFNQRDYFNRQNKMGISLKYIDPTYMIGAIPCNAADSVYCTLLAHNAVHGAMAGYTGFTVGPVNGRHAYIPLNRILEKQNKVVIMDKMWARLVSSTNQPSFLWPEDVVGKGNEKTTYSVV